MAAVKVSVPVQTEVQQCSLTRLTGRGVGQVDENVDPFIADINGRYSLEGVEACRRCCKRGGDDCSKGEPWDAQHDDDLVRSISKETRPDRSGFL